MKRNQKADTYSENRRYKIYGLYNGSWEILGFSKDKEAAAKKYQRWSEEDGAYIKAADQVLKFVDTLTNEVIASQNC